MCGIGGGISLDVGEGRTLAEHINARQGHRGPDHSVVVPVGPFTIANTRLAIQDPTPAGNQPFRSADGRFVCVFNGEIYNFVELIKRFRLQLPNHCDGAVIPELWARLGAAALQELRGMFAIALVDTEAEKLVLARDPFGVKPLYYRQLGNGALAFASEVRSLTTLGGSPTLDRAALTRFLQLGAVGRDQSPFAGIEAVAPNTVMTFTADSRATAAPLLDERQLLRTEDPRDLGSVFRESVDIHLRADVPTVLLLSSGVDSSTIAASARDLGRDLNCMTIGGMGGDPDESMGAASIARHYGHPHQVAQARIDNESVAQFFEAMQRPSIDGLNTFIVCRAVQQAGFRVALSGLGGDEALGGYAHYKVLPLLGALELADRVPALGRAAADLLERFGRGGPNPEKLSRLIRAGGPRSAKGLDRLQREVLAPAVVSALTGDPLNGNAVGLDNGPRDFAALVEAELEHYMQATLLPDADAYSMCSSVELRVPFVDRQVFATAVSSNAGRRRSPGKRLLAEALGDEFLLELTRKRKRGFTVPMAEWMRNGPLRSVLDDVHDPAAPIWDHLDRVAAEPLLSAPVSERWSAHWALAALNGWLRSISSDSQAPPL